MGAAGGLEINGASSKLDFAIKFNIEITKMGLSDCLEQELREFLLSWVPVGVPEQFPSTSMFNKVFKLINYVIHKSYEVFRGINSSRWKRVGVGEGVSFFVPCDISFWISGEVVSLKVWARCLLFGPLPNSIRMLLGKFYDC